MNKKRAIQTAAYTGILLLLLLCSYNNGFNAGRRLEQNKPFYAEIRTPEPKPLPTPTQRPLPTPTPEPELISLGTFTAYAYDACYSCCGKSPDNPYYGITATGTRATEGRTIAVDPSVIPLGSEVVVKVNGHTHTYIAEDTGKGIVGKTIDIYHESHQEAWNHGTKTVEVFIKK